MWKKKLSEGFNQTAVNVFLCSTVSYWVIISLCFFFALVVHLKSVDRVRRTLTWAAVASQRKEVKSVWWTREDPIYLRPRRSPLISFSLVGRWKQKPRGDLLSHLLVGTGTATIRVVTSSCESSWASEQVWEAGVSSFSENSFVRTGVSCFLPSSAKTRRTEFSKLQKIYLYALAIFARVTSD